MFYWKTVIVLFHTIISITKFVKMREFSPKRIIRIIRIRNNYGYSGVVCVCVCGCYSKTMSRDLQSDERRADMRCRQSVRITMQCRLYPGLLGRRSTGPDRVSS